MIEAMWCLSVVLLLLIGATTLIHANRYKINRPKLWWETTTLYQIWPSSFKDSNGDGIGDLNGVTSKLDHFVDMGIEVIWLSPFYPSPMADSGYDISDYRNVYPKYGTLDDFDTLVAEAKKRGLKVIVDYVPNHTSDEHEWFIKSKKCIEPYTDYYVWNKGVIDANGTRQPPNNWLSAFNSAGSAWEWVEERQAYYLHQFNVKQPDLNFRNPRVIGETKDIITFWLDRDIDGFRMDAVPFLVEDDSLADEPESGIDGFTPSDYYYLDHIYTKDRLGSYDIVQIWRDRIENYSATKCDNIVRVMFTEAYANVSSVMRYYDYGAHVPFNFFFIKDRQGVKPATLDTATDVVDVINLWMENMPQNKTANWVFGNHDNSRIATKLGKELVDGIHSLLCLLPGIATFYNGDEIGMTDTYLTWEETTDPQACSTDRTRYQSFSRDPERTPYQWDNTTSAGFSSNSTTLLPVNSNYRTLNLAAQREARISNYKNVQAVIKLRNRRVIREGSLEVRVIDESVVAFSRELEGQKPIVVLVNWSDTTVTVSLKKFERIPNRLKVLVADINSGINVGDVYVKTRVGLPGNAAVVLEGMQRRNVHQSHSCFCSSD